MSTIIVYTKPNCPQCELTKRDMNILGIEFKAIDVTQDQAHMDRLIGQGFRSLPVVQAEGETWNGYNQEKIKSLVSYA